LRAVLRFIGLCFCVSVTVDKDGARILFGIMGEVGKGQKRRPFDTVVDEMLFQVGAPRFRGKPTLPLTTSGGCSDVCDRRRRCFVTVRGMLHEVFASWCRGAIRRDADYSASCHGQMFLTER
jgi:hypothetical protein